MKIVYVRDEGVLAMVVRDGKNGVRARWFVDGIKFEYFLEDDEYIVVDHDFGGDVDE